jgi:hypothetical protein
MVRMANLGPISKKPRIQSCYDDLRHDFDPSKSYQPTSHELSLLQLGSSVFDAKTLKHFNTMLPNPPLMSIVLKHVEKAWPSYIRGQTPPKFKAPPKECVGIGALLAPWKMEEGILADIVSDCNTILHNTLNDAKTPLDLRTAVASSLDVSLPQSQMLDLKFRLLDGKQKPVCKDTCRLLLQNPLLEGHERRQLLALSGISDVSIAYGTPTPLMVAAFRNNAQQVRMLLEADCDIHATSLSGRTALDFWLDKPRTSDDPVLQCFWSKGARHGENVNWIKAAKTGDSLAMQALMPKITTNEILEELDLKCYAPLFVLTLARVLPPSAGLLQRICGSSKEPFFAVQKLLERGLQLPSIDWQKAAEAVLWSSTRPLRTLKLLGVERLQLKTSESLNLLQIACSVAWSLPERSEIVKWLIEAGDDPMRKDPKSGKTGLERLEAHYSKMPDVEAAIRRYKWCLAKK